MPPNLPLPRGWKRRVRSPALHILAPAPLGLDFSNSQTELYCLCTHGGRTCPENDMGKPRRAEPARPSFPKPTQEVTNETHSSSDPNPLSRHRLVPDDRLLRSSRAGQESIINTPPRCHRQRKLS